MHISEFSISARFFINVKNLHSQAGFMTFMQLLNKKQHKFELHFIFTFT